MTIALFWDVVWVRLRALKSALRCGPHKPCFAVGVELVVLAEELERRDLRRELELHAADLAGVLAAAVHELIDRHLDQGRNLSSSPLEPCSGSWAPGGLYNE